MEAQLESGNSPEVRLALVRLLIVKKQFTRARELAILGFKDPTIPPKYRDLFWNEYKTAQ